MIFSKALVGFATILLNFNTFLTSPPQGLFVKVFVENGRGTHRGGLMKIAKFDAFLVETLDGRRFIIILITGYLV